MQSSVSIYSHSKHIGFNRVLVKIDILWNESHHMVGLGWTIENQNRISSFSALDRHVTSPLAVEALALREAILSAGILAPQYQMRI